MVQLFLTILGALFLGGLKADYPLDCNKETFDFSAILRNEEETVYRLPENVIPVDYDIDIDLAFTDEGRQPYSYNGRVKIIIQAVESNVTQIVLHSNVDRINTVNLVAMDNEPVSLDSVQPITLEPQYHFLKINLAQTLELGSNYSLTIGYSSTMNEGPLRRGIWRGFYNDANGNRKIYATTHFQPYNARQAFPCWDEPLFKATFTLHLTRPREYGAVFSNTRISSSDTLADSRVKDSFLTTPVMSSYLLTFLVSESFTVIAEDTSFVPPIRIIARSNTIGLGDKALEYAVKMTRFFDEYFGLPYGTLHPNLNNDHISSPDWASAGTENWGMVSYRELYMILDSRETIMSNEHYAATLVSHEIAHKWFGNLITCFWWSNTWINEGFASYFGYIATHEVFPEYDHHEHFNSRYLQTSLSYDSSTSTEAMNHEVNTPSQVTGHFGTISYSKGAAFLRMTANIISAQTFRKACQYFLVDNAFEATNQYDLYQAFDRAIVDDEPLTDYPNFNFTHYYDVWVNEPGYPILSVDINFSSGEMTLSQERFFLSASANPTGQIYPIPITYSNQNNPDFTTLKPMYMMTNANAVLLKEPGEEWVIFNNLQHGHYRVNYNTRNWELIADALLNNIESIHYLNRAQIVDDVFAFMRSGRMTYEYGFWILRFLRNEYNYHVWNPAISGYSWLRNRLRHIPESHALFESSVLSNMETAIQSVGFEVMEGETPTISLARQELLHFACQLGHEQCVRESRERFSSMRNGNWIDPRIRRNVYVVGVREGGEEDFTFLMNRYLESNIANDQLEMMRGLGATRNPALLTRYLEFTLTDAVRQHDKTNAFNYALLGNKENADTALQFLINNINRIREVYVAEAPNAPVHTVMSNMAAYLDESGLQVYESWLQSTQSGTAQYATAISAINSARNNMAWGDQNADTIISAARDGATVVLASLTMMIAMVSFAIFAV